MRLDHLLSKEHVQLALYTGDQSCQPLQGRTFLVALMGGTLTLVSSEALGSQYAPPGAGTDSVDELETCTLLGPEGPGRRNGRESRKRLSRQGAERILWTSFSLTRCQVVGVPPVF